MKSIKKLYIPILFLLFIIVGCGKNWEDKIQVSELKYDNGYIIGKIKNLTDLRYDLTIIIDLKNNNQTIKGIVYTDVINSNEIKKVKYKCDEIKNINDNYKIIIKEILVSPIAIYHQNGTKEDLNNYLLVYSSVNKIIKDLINFKDYKNLKFAGFGTSSEECGISYPICINYDTNSSKNLLFYYDSNYSLKEILIECKFGSYPEIIIDTHEKIALMDILNISKDDLIDPDENDILFNNDLDNYNAIMNNDFEKYYKTASQTFLILNTQNEQYKITDKISSKTHSFKIEIN